MPREDKLRFSRILPPWWGFCIASALHCAASTRTAPTHSAAKQVVRLSGQDGAARLQLLRALRPPYTINCSNRDCVGGGWQLCGEETDEGCLIRGVPLVGRPGWELYDADNNSIGVAECGDDRSDDCQSGGWRIFPTRGSCVSSTVCPTRNCNEGWQTRTTTGRVLVRCVCRDPHGVQCLSAGATCSLEEQ